jgi:fructokinase
MPTWPAQLAAALTYNVANGGWAAMNQGTSARLVVGLGELLWDLLPEGRQLGGAPANIAVMSARLGSHAIVLSRVGQDQLGRDAVDTLETFPIDLGHLQVDEVHSTGSVSVTFVDGQPGYTIAEPVAWDFLEFTPDWQQLAAQADAVCFGTLAQRGPCSMRTVQSFLDGTKPYCVRVFDVNLRPPFYSRAVVEGSIGCATILKMNDVEVPLVLRLLDLRQDETPAAPTSEYLVAAAKLLLSQFPLKLICITRGGHGSVLVTPEATHIHPGVPANVADTIGAGDAFTAALTHYYLQGAPLDALNEAGNRWGAWVASQSGAMPPLSEEVVALLRAQISLVAG